MAASLKTFFDAAIVRRIAREVRAAWPEFPATTFTRDATNGLDAFELMGRARHIAARSVAISAGARTRPGILVDRCLPWLR
jgi:hypothetical protein